MSQFEVIDIPQPRYGAGYARQLYVDIGDALDGLPIGKAIRVPIEGNITLKNFMVRVRSSWASKKGYLRQWAGPSRRLRIVQAGTDAIAIWAEPKETAVRS